MPTESDNENDLLSQKARPIINEFNKQKLVAFIDILGYKGEIKNKNFKAAFILDKTLRSDTRSHKIVYPEISIKPFSDCLCLSCEIEDHLFGERMAGMFSVLSTFQEVLACNGIFLRGGLVKGNHFESANIIFSTSLLNAIEIEKKASSPRILIDDNLILEFKERSYKTNNAGSALGRFLIDKRDNSRFIDYLPESPIESLRQTYGRIKSAIEMQIMKNRNNDHVLEKYRWLTAYYNFKIKELFQSLDMSDLRIESEFLEFDFKKDLFWFAPDL